MTPHSNSLPQPSPELYDHSQKLIRLICDEIDKQGGAISFARYMELALYAPGLGYYSAGLKKFGAEGDFVTAPEISSLFSRTLAVQCAQVLKHIDSGDILEFGAGSGVLAADLLIALEQQNCLPAHYYILEISADLRARQQQLLRIRIPHLFSRIAWLDHLPEKPLQGVILANEVLDAMPIQRFHLMHDAIKEYYVSYSENKFIWQLKTIEPLTFNPPFSAEEIQTLAQSAEYTLEMNTLLPHWINSLNTCLTQGLVLLIDYGFPHHEYYHADRYMGTLMCHYRQRAHSDPLILTGLQDITAHVDFTAVAEAAVNSGLKVAGFTNQTAFLLSLGLLNLANESTTHDLRQQLIQNQQIQKLTSPAEMGELFKVMALTKNLQNINLLGFSLQDQRQRL